MAAKSTLEHVLRRFQKVHGDRYDYSQVCYINTITPVKVCCREHGVFETTPDNHYAGNGCPECSKRNLGVANRLSLEIIKKRLAETQGLRYIYALDSYVRGTELRYLCPTHGWKIQSIHQLIPVGCPACRREISRVNGVGKETGSISFDRLSHVLTCDLDTGRLYHKKPGKSWSVGDEVIYSQDRKGYIVTRINRKLILVHRIVLAFALGRMLDPGKSCDHINGVITDNRALNLREVDHQDNLRNCKLNVNSQTKVNGVGPGRTKGTYRARIFYNGKDIHLGTFPSIEEAALVRAAADKELGFHPNHGKTAETRANTT